jgi:hypothetical protein
MTKIFIAMATGSLILASAAQAHLKNGIYAGKTPAGTDCQMKVVENYFDGAPHPLTERIRIEVGNQTFRVGHPPVLDPTRKFVRFDHNQFQGINPQTWGATALIIQVHHIQSREDGAQAESFTLLSDAYEMPTRSSLECGGLQFRN